MCVCVNEIDSQYHKVFFNSVQNVNGVGGRLCGGDIVRQEWFGGAILEWFGGGHRRERVVKLRSSIV